MNLKNFKHSISIFIIIGILLSISNASYADSLIEIDQNLEQTNNTTLVDDNIKSIKDVDEDLEIGDYIILDEYIPFSSPNPEEDSNLELNSIKSSKQKINNSGKKNFSTTYILLTSLGLIFILYNLKKPTKAN